MMDSQQSRPLLSESGVQLVILTCVEGSVASALLLARLYTAWKITHHARLDLYLSVITYTIAVLGSVFLALAVNSGLGSRDIDLPKYELHKALKWNWVNQTLGVMATGLGKMVIVAFLHQMHGPDNRRRIGFLWGLAASNMLVNCITVGMIYTQCSPSMKLWNADLPGTCDGLVRNSMMAYFQGSWSAFCDLALALYPTLFLWNVRLERKVKLGLCVLMGLGVIACACAIGKTTTFSVLKDTKSPPTYAMTALVASNETEKWVVFIVGSIAPIRPLLMKFSHRVVRSARTMSSKRGRQVGGRATELQSFSNYKHTSQAIRISAGFGDVFEGHKSDENILPADDGFDGIIKTTEVSLSYEEGSHLGMNPSGMHKDGMSYSELPYGKV